MNIEQRILLRHCKVEFRNNAPFYISLALAVFVLMSISFVIFITI